MCGLYIHLAILVGERSSPFIYCVMRISKDEKLKHKMTIILTTHYLEEVQFLADSAAIISKGRIKAVGTIPEILASTNSNTLEEAFIKLSEEE